MELGIKQIRTGITAAKETIKAAKQNFYLDINPMEINSLPQGAIDQLYHGKEALGRFAAENHTFISFFDVAKEYGEKSIYTGKEALGWGEGATPDANLIGIRLHKLGIKKPKISYTIPYEEGKDTECTFLGRVYQSIVKTIAPEKAHTSVQEESKKHIDNLLKKGIITKAKKTPDPGQSVH